MTTTTHDAGDSRSISERYIASLNITPEMVAANALEAKRRHLQQVEQLLASPYCRAHWLTELRAQLAQLREEVAQLQQEVA
jgi:hypothetical protein